MEEAEVKALMKKAYKAGMRDGWVNKGWPTYGELDDTINEIYQLAVMAKQEEQALEVLE